MKFPAYRAVAALLLCCLWAAPLPAQPAKGTSMTVVVDASDAPRKFLHAVLTIPAQAGPLTLYYPKWVPGEHGPTGPITDLAGLKIQAGRKTIPWQRDDVDMYAFHCTVPERATAIEVTLNFLSPATTSGFSSGGSMTSNLAVLNWNQLVLYPKGPLARDIECRASLRLSAGWKLGTALTTAG